jgi:molybdopterin molybdotransferase
LDSSGAFVADLITVEETRGRVLTATRPLAPEPVAAADALGRVLAEDVVAGIDLPPFDSSAMDGFAVVAGPGGELPVVGESRAGTPFDRSLEGGQAVRISTGAVIPAGADAVVPIERVEDLGEQIRAPETRPGANVRRAGDDVRAGQSVLHAGMRVGAAELGMLAAMGVESVACARRPRVAIVATGDELRPPGEPLGPGQIHDSNAVTLGAMAALAGAEVVSRSGAGDDRAATLDALRSAVRAADAVCVSGGVSVGPHDHVRPALAELGVEQQLWGVRLKPGKPFWFGARDDGGERTLVFGLPGNPVSAIVTFQLFVLPALRALQGADPGASRSTALLDAPIARDPARDQAVRCRLRLADDGWHAEPTGPQGSHVLSSMVGAGALAVVPAGEGEIAPGERVAVELL